MREAGVEGRLVEPPRPQHPDGLEDGVADDPARCLAFACPQGPDPLAFLGQVDELEEHRERTRHRLRVTKFGRARRAWGGDASAGMRPAARHHGPARGIHQACSVGARLFGDRVAKHPPQEPDLAGQGILRHRGALRAQPGRNVTGDPAFVPFVSWW